ncbi:MAG TPA: glycine oxidase ThiO [Pyrinomonadaceae bacterium]|nr:glycine oxidase ThiO [Pyrinomonadaceae bacterium]
MNSEILIIGAGVIGLALARSLKKSGAAGQITILERGSAGREASLAAAGMLAPQAETDKTDDFFDFCRQSNKLYPQFAAELLDETGIDIELDRAGTLYLAFSDEDVREINRRYAWQKGAGLPVEYLTAEEIRRSEPFVSPDVREGLFFPNDWQVENRKLLFALQKFAGLNAIKIVENAEVKNLIVENGRAAGAETETEKFSASAVILTAGAWTSLVKANNLDLPFEVRPIRGQMLSFQTARRVFRRVIYSPRGYLVPRRDGRILAGATVEDVGFDKSLTEAGIDFLFEHALEIAPSLANLEITDKWCGLRPFAAGAMPVLGALPEAENLFVATAHYRNGILLAPVTAETLAGKIVKNVESRYLRIFSPAANGRESRVATVREL